MGYSSPWKRWLKVVVFLLLFLWWGSSRFIYVDFKQGCAITVEPAFLNFNNRSIVDALKILKNASPADYTRTCAYVEHIGTTLPPTGCPFLGGGCFWSKNPNNIYIQHGANTQAITASTIAHEACHAEQFARNEDGSEPECYAAGTRVIKNIISLP